MCVTPRQGHTGTNLTLSVRSTIVLKKKAVFSEQKWSLLPGVGYSQTVSMALEILL